MTGEECGRRAHRVHHAAREAEHHDVVARADRAELGVARERHDGGGAPVDAQKTDAKQTNKTLLLSERAQIQTKPQLEIYNNDVKCTHAATIGRLDENALFYLRSRGVDRKTARRLLVHAFASDIINRVRGE